MLNPDQAERVRFRLTSPIIVLFLGYLIGSIPTAFLLVRWKTNHDIRKEGSGNVGARNAFDVTGSCALGVAVLLLDVIKGATAVILSSTLFGWSFLIAAVAGISAILGHNYSVWIRFSGGRGLATGVGVCAVIAWPLVVVWCAGWLVTYPLFKNVHLANVAAIIAMPAVSWFIPWRSLQSILPRNIEPMELFVFALLVSLCLLIRHIQPLLDLRKSSVHHS
jgi:acyl phosphate:glycerol-3-phosphate acyltransferase